MILFVVYTSCRTASSAPCEGWPCAARSRRPRPQPRPYGSSRGGNEASQAWAAPSETSSRPPRPQGSARSPGTVRHAVRRPQGRRRRSTSSRDRQRHDPRADRPQRFRQEHDDEPADGHLHADRRETILLEGAVDRGPGARRGSRARGVARTFQNVQLVRRTDAARKRAGGAAPHLCRSTLARRGAAPAARPTARKRARASACGRHPELRRDCAMRADEEARNLPYGKQRLLEIGARIGARPEIAVAGRAGRGPDCARHRRTERHHPGKIRDHGHQRWS